MAVSGKARLADIDRAMLRCAAWPIPGKQAWVRMPRSVWLILGKQACLVFIPRGGDVPHGRFWESKPAVRLHRGTGMRRTVGSGKASLSPIHRASLLHISQLGTASGACV